jgi:hypothetical protein
MRVKSRNPPVPPDIVVDTGAAPPPSEGREKRGSSRSFAPKAAVHAFWVVHRRIIYLLNISIVTGGFFMDSFLDVALLWTFHQNGEHFYRNLSAGVLVFSSTVIAFTAILDARQQQKKRSVIIACLLGFSRFELLYEAFRSVSSMRIARGYGTRRYYQIKFWTGVSASAPQAVLQTFILITSPFRNGNVGRESVGMQVILQLSILSALLSLTYIAYEKDHWFVKEHRHEIQYQDKHIYTLAAISFRLCEVCSRATSLAFAAMLLPWVVFITYVLVDVCMVACLFTGTQMRSLNKAARKRALTDPDAVAARIKSRSMLCVVGVYAPCAVVIWPLALLESRKGARFTALSHTRLYANLCAFTHQLSHTFVR